jgi:hypothetical protein
MKNQIYSKTVVFIAVLLTLLSIPAIAGDAPHYRGKLILLVDKSVAADTTVSAKLERMEADLVGDGWRVLRTDVERGASPYLNTVTWDANPQFKQQNSPLVRQVRALIKADYDAAPNDLKGILNFGHVLSHILGPGALAAGGITMARVRRMAFTPNSWHPMDPVVGQTRLRGMLRSRIIRAILMLRGSRNLIICRMMESLIRISLHRR